MDNKITLREIQSSRDIERFWQEMDAMLLRDVVPDHDLGEPMTPEEAAYFRSPDYREGIEALCRRREDPCRRAFFLRDGREIGFVLYVIYGREDGKCFLLDFCVYPPYRCQGLGKACFAALARRMEAEGAAYFELNTHCRRSARFWESLGFRYNGYDDHGSILLCRPPARPLPLTVERLTDPEGPDLGWQLRKLMNGFLTEIGEARLDDDRWERLCRAVRAGRIAFFLALRGYRAVGMCSVSRCFSTFTCDDTGVFDDFFVEPVFRRQGGARLLARAAQTWCREQGLASLTVGCSAGDVGMYRALGFGEELGTMLAHVDEMN